MKNEMLSTMLSNISYEYRTYELKISREGDAMSVAEGLTTVHPYIYNGTISIDQLNHERRLFQLPVVITMGIIMVAAIFGNILVIYVYFTRKITPASFFIILLAVGDLISSSLCIPFQMFDLSNPYKYPVPVACKIFRFLETVVNIWCGLILMCIAFDRYFKICNPLQTYTMGKARSLAIVMFAITLSMSWPQLFLVGKRTVPTPIEGVYGEDCSTQDGLFGSVYSLLFQGSISLLFGICLLIFLLFYSSIFIVVIRRKRRTIGESYSFRSSSQNEKTMNGADENDMPLDVFRRSCSKSQDNIAFTDEETEKYIQRAIRDSAIENEDLRHSKGSMRSNCTELSLQNALTKKIRSSIGSISERLSLSESYPSTRSARVGKITSRVRIRTTRTTLIFALVTLAGVIGFTPYLIVEVLRQAGVAFQPGMTSTEDLMYEFLSKSYFLNNIANPLIYSIMNPAFRKNSRIGLKKIFKCI